MEKKAAPCYTFLAFLSTFQDTAKRDKLLVFLYLADLLVSFQPGGFETNLTIF